MKRIPSVAPCPVVPIIVTAESCVAITESPTAHHGRLRFARKYPSTLSLPFVRFKPSWTTHTRYAATTVQSIQCMSAGEVVPDEPETEDDERREDEHADRGGSE